MDRTAILLVEPRAEVLAARRAALEQRGFAVWPCAGADEACRRAAAGPDLVLLGAGVEPGEALELLELLSLGLGQRVTVAALIADRQGEEDWEDYGSELLKRSVWVLPAEADDDHLAEGLSAALSARHKAQRPSVLVLERGGDALMRALAAAGFHPRRCADLGQLLDWAAKAAPHAVIVRDVPALLGVDPPAAELVRLARRVPLVVLGDRVDGARHAAWLEAGAAAYAGEPLDLGVLIDRLDPPRANSRPTRPEGLSGSSLGEAQSRRPSELASHPRAALRIEPTGHGSADPLLAAMARAPGLFWARLDREGRVLEHSEALAACFGALPRDAVREGEDWEVANGTPRWRMQELLAGEGQRAECEALLARTGADATQPVCVSWTLRDNAAPGGARRLLCELFAPPGGGADVLLVGQPQPDGRGDGADGSGGEVFWIADGDGLSLHYASPAFEQLAGVRRERLLSEGFLLTHCVHEEDRPRLVRAGETLAEGSPTELEYRILRPDGEVRWVRTRSFPVLDQKGRPWRVASLSRDVTERRRAEEALRESEQRLSSVVTSAPIALFSIDRQGYFRLSDGRGLERMGIAPGQVVGRSIYDVYRDAPSMLANLRRALGGEAFTATVDLRGASFETSYSPIFEQSGEVSGVIGVAIDVTDRRRAERRLELIVEATSAVAGQGFFRSLVRYLTRALGVRMAYVAELLPGTQRLVLRCLWTGNEYREDREYPSEGTPDAQVLRDGTLFVPVGVAQRFAAHSLVHGLGVQSYLGLPIHDSASRVIGVLGVMHDGPLDERVPTESILRIFSARVGVEIERLRAEGAVRESEARWRSLVENAPDLIATLDRQGRVLFANRGLSPEREGQPSPEYHLLVGGERSRLGAAIAQVFQSAEPRAFEHRLLLPDGRDVWYAVRLGPLERDGEVVSVVLIATDVTQRKEAEVKLEFRASLEKLVTSTSTRFINLDAEDVDEAIQSALRSIGVFCGVDRCYVFQFRDGHRALDNTHEWCAHGVEPFVGRIQADEPACLPSLFVRVRNQGHVFVQKVGALGELEADLRGELGQLGVRSLLCVPMTCGGSGVGFLGFDTVRWEVSWDEQVVSLLRIVGDVFANTLERKRAEESRSELESQLRQSQKLEAIGTLAGGVAHDFNNLLTGILGYASFLKQAVGGDPAVRRAVEVIENAAGRAADLTRQLLGFARRGEARRVPVRVHGLVLEITELLERTIDKRVVIEHHLHAPIDLILGDAGQLGQVVLNLAVNARDAMPDGGHMRIATRVVELWPEDAHLFPELSPGAYLELSVSDDGVGIPKDVQTRIFEPFFTTKGPGKGSGMGLAVVYGILRGHGGSIRVESEPGQGATFRLLLPLSEAAAPVEAAGVVREVIEGSGLVLVVDDEPIVRSTAAELLKSLGYRVLLAEDGAAALEVYRAHRSEISVVLLDLVMPVMDGRQCLARLREVDPDVRVVLSSGFGFEDLAHDVAKAGLAGFARKPYQLAELSRIVAQAAGNGPWARDMVIPQPRRELPSLPRDPSESSAEGEEARPGSS